MLGLALVSRPAFAHPGHGLVTLMAGLTHPLSGLDHLLTALAVGIWAVRSKDGVKLSVPAAFIAAMILGALAGQAGFAFRFYEQGILLSLICIGAFLVLGIAPGRRSGALAVACFGLMHGNAHGVEVDAVGLSAGALCGLIFSTAMLHSLGIGCALGFRVLKGCRKA